MTLTFAKRTTLLLVGLALVGCAQGGTPVKPVAVEPDLVSLRIAQSAEKAAGALDEIAGIEQQRAPAMPPADDYTSAPPALSQMITVKWAGPAEQMLETLASRAGMRFDSKGNRPGVPLMVNVNVYQKPMIEVLHDLGLQVGRRADITVNGTLNVIEIRYAPVDRT